MLTNFLKTYPIPKSGAAFKHTAMVRHNGTIIAFAINEDRQIVYSVLDLRDQGSKGPLDVNYWQDNPQDLVFPNEVVTVGEGLFAPRMMPVFKKGSPAPVTDGSRVKENEKDLFRSTTASLSAEAPIQVLSDNRYVYLFRQSITNEAVGVNAGTLLVDRFVFAGDKLMPKLEVRFQRSRNKHVPQSRKDGLGAKDMEQQPFYEPTQKLEFVRHLSEGRFAVLLLPTQIAGALRWQIFAHNSATGSVDSFNIERAADGLFNLRGTQRYTCPDHSEVFQLQAGACPEPASADPSQPCPFELVPILSKEGYAEWALSFDEEAGSGIAVRQPLPEAQARYQTIEMWLKPQSRDQAQSLWSERGEQAGAATIDPEGRLHYQYAATSGNGATLQFLSTIAALPANTWSHIALVRDAEAGSLRWFINGVPDNAAMEIDEAATPAANLVTGIGPEAGFRGLIDEVRLWRRPRQYGELAEQMRHRLIGHETGLMLYWRFDEGSGQAAYDQTEFANHGQIDPALTWVESDAPVGDHPGMRRTSFRFYDREVTAGMSALLFYHQKRSKSGYDGQEKPIKTIARVLLALGTRALEDDDGKNYITVLDFAMSRDGKLAQIPDNLQLESIEITGDRRRTSREIQDDIRFNETREQELQQLLDELSGSIDWLPETPFLHAAMRRRAQGDAGEQLLFVRDRFTIGWQEGENSFDDGGDDAPQVHAMASWVYGSGTYAEFVKDADGARVTAVEEAGDGDGDGQSDSETSATESAGQETELSSEKRIGTPEWLEAWTGWESPGGTSEAAFALASRYYYFKGNRYRIFDSTTREFSTPLAIQDGEFPQLWRTGIDAAVELDDTHVCFFKELAYKKYLLADGEYTLESEGTIQELYPGLPFLFLHPEYMGQVPAREIFDEEIFEVRARLNALRQALIDAQIRELENLEVQVAMPVVHTDPFGLSTSGGVLSFAWSKSAPLLFDSANGKIALYFQGANEQFYVTYYDTMTHPANFELPASDGSSITCIPRFVGPVDGVRIKVEAGDEEQLCHVTIENLPMGLHESWQHVPRAVREFAAILNGTAAQQFAGRLTRQIAGIVERVPVAGTPEEILRTGQALVIGGHEAAILAVETGAAIIFDGRHDFLEFAGNQISDRGTIELWVKFVDVLQDQTLFDASTPETNPGTGKYFYLGLQDGNLRFALEDDADADFGVFVNLSNRDLGDDWHHVAATWNYNSRELIRLYLDGELVAMQDARAGKRPTFRNPYFGKPRSDYAARGIFRGQLGEICLRDRPLTLQEIRERQTEDVLQVAPQTISGCWRFHDDDGDVVAADITGQQPPATIHGAPTLIGAGEGDLVFVIESIVLEAALAAGEPVYVTYDYANNASFSHRRKDRRSALFVADPGKAVGSAQNAVVDGEGLHVPTTRWIAYAQGSALEFDGRLSTARQQATAQLPQFDAENNVTIESWVRPEPGSGRSYSPVVYHNSNQSRYFLGLQRQQLVSAMAFNAGRHDKAFAWAAAQRWHPFLGSNWAYAAAQAAISEYDKGGRTRNEVANAAERAARNAIRPFFFFLRNRVNYERFRVGELAREWALTWFDLHNDYIECNSTARLNPGDRAWTVELWFRADRINGQNILFNKEPVYEAAVMDGYLQFAWQPHWQWVKVEQFPVVQGRWYHVAISYDGNMQRVYRDGQLVLERAQTGSIGGNDTALLLAARYLGSPANGPQLFLKGAIDEVRVWSEARSQAQIVHNLIRRLRGDETNLQAYWHFDDDIARDYTHGHNHGLIHGQPRSTLSPLPGYAISAMVGFKDESGFQQTHIQSKTAFPFFDWNHIAATYQASFALRFDDDDALLDCGRNVTLSLSDDLTIEVFFRVDNLRQPRGILTKGEVVPAYSLHLATDGRLVFSFTDERGDTHSFIAGPESAIQPGQFYRCAVTRRHQTETRDVVQRRSINGEIVEVTIPEVEEWDDIEIHVCAWTGSGYERRIGYSQKYGGPKPGGNEDNLLIGRGSVRASAPFRGIISEVRLWSRALGQFETCQKIQGSESGLVSWWRLEDNKGYAAEDFTGTNHASISLAEWVRNPDPEGPVFALLCNGIYLDNSQRSLPAIAMPANSFSLARSVAGSANNALRGSLEELRIWRSARTQEQIQDNLFLRLHGEREDLIAYYTFDQEEKDNELRDHSFRGNHLRVLDASFVVSDAPVSHDTFKVRNALLAVQTPFHDTIHSQPGVQEYGDLQYDAEGNLIGILKRCYAYIKDGQWQLITGYKVGNLVTEWLGQVQFNPELKGYIEGAPPVPSENLTAGPIDPALFDYAGSASVEVVEAENVTYTYATSKEAGLSASVGMSAQFGVDTTVLLITAPLGIGTAQEITDVNVLVGLQGRFDASAGWSSENSVGIGRNLTRSTRVQLGGNWEDPTRQLNKAMRRRYQPANTGFALVQSETADVFALRLEHNLALVSFQFRPNPDIPKDWNIIPFPINPRYTKQGTLDGAVGYDERGKVLDPSYPNAGVYGEHSYFKPKEAYRLKNRIVQEEQELINYFRSVDTNLGGATDHAVSAGLGLISGAAQGGAGGAIQGLVNALSSSTGLPEKLGKQNLVNTYVWTAEGGFFAETTEAMMMKQESTSGTFSFSGEVGAAIGVDFSVAGVDVSLGFNAMLGGSLNLTKTKTKESQNAFRLEVSIGIPGDLQAYNENLVRLYDNTGNPIIVPGKVDAYRFMTFYLEPATGNFETFFNTVVDPIWLQGNHPNAIALKQAQQNDKKPPCWRVMHRVTFVSRILPEIPPPTAPPLERNMKIADVDSNWQLIQKLEPFVRNKTGSFAEFSDAIRKAVHTYLPELEPSLPEIIQYLSAYYQVFDEA